MKFSQILAWRLYVWFRAHTHFFYKLGISSIALSLLVLLSFLILTVSHETVLAQSGVESNPTDVAEASSQNIRGLVDSSTVKAKKHTAAKQVKPSEVILHNKVSTGHSLTAKIPILMYHKTPADFERQLEAVQAKSYTPIHMSELTQILRGEIAGPQKPLVITFDDGFANQTQAFDMLQKHNMKATFYIIIGGQLSQGCLGAERHRADCGDDYLNWSQISALAQSELVEIGSHTFDHPDLPTLSSAEQIHQIIGSKHYIEQKLGREITTLAYPYGRFNPAVVQQARNAGYSSAVTTLGGIDQSTNSIFELHRVRDATILP